MARALKFRQSQAGGRQPGERARIKVVAGPDFGSVFVITGERASVGRGEESDIMLLDLKASRSHAEFVFSGQWIIRDAGSANGILHNGRPARQAALRSGDTVTVGETILEFTDAAAATRVLVAPPRQASPELQSLREPRSAARASSRPAAAPVSAAEKRRRIIWAAFVLMGFLFAMDSDKREMVGDGLRRMRDRSPATAIPAPKPPDEIKRPPENPSARRDTESFMKAGFREFRERNYLRAKQAFDNVLQVSPNHPTARRYSEICARAIEEEIARHLEEGEKGLSAGRLKDARNHFEAVTRLRRADPSDPALMKARERLDDIRRRIERKGTG